MRKLEFNDIQILIDLEAGLYVLPGDGATGKTYLGKLLQAAKANGVENVAYVTYDADLTEQGILDKLKVMQDGVLVVDRFDLYQSEAVVERLKQISKGSVVLVDVKNLNSLKLGKYRFATISRAGENCIGVCL